MNAFRVSRLQQEKVSLEDRIDISGIRLDQALPAVTRAEQYLRLVKNPYAFKCGEIAVNVRFTPGGKTLKDALSAYLSMVKS